MLISKSIKVYPLRCLLTKSLQQILISAMLIAESTCVVYPHLSKKRIDYGGKFGKIKKHLQNKENRL